MRRNEPAVYIAEIKRILREAKRLIDHTKIWKEDFLVSILPKDADVNRSDTASEAAIRK
jgi:hypothetical protein